MLKNADKHESYGTVVFNRVSVGGKGLNLFGSSIRNSNVIQLSIKRASRYRDLNREWIHPEEELIEVTLSPNQFANLLTSMNVGEGVPCTINHFNGKIMEESPSYEQRAKFEDEFENGVRKVMNDASVLAQEVTELLSSKKNITQPERKEIMDKLRMLMQHINSNIPFVQSSFNEAMDKTVSEARAEVEAFVDAKIHSLGISALNEEISQALAAPTKSPALQNVSIEEK